MPILVRIYVFSLPCSWLLNEHILIRLCFHHTIEKAPNSLLAPVSIMDLIKAVSLGLTPLLHGTHSSETRSEGTKSLVRIGQGLVRIGQGPNKMST